MSRKSQRRASRGRMSFQRFGRAYHLRIGSVEDLERIPQLDEALWVAISAPVATLHADPVFLELLDSDHDGQIRAVEVRRAVGWLLDCLEDRSGVRPGNTTLELSAVRGDHEDGARVLLAGRKMLAAVGSHGGGSDGGQLTLEQVREIKEKESHGQLSEAGVVHAAAAPEPRIERFLADILATVGDRPNGEQGIDAEVLKRFLEAARAYLGWVREAEAPAQGERSPIYPLGDATAVVHDLLTGLQPKIEHYFRLCDAVRLDPALAEQSGPPKAVDLSSSEAVESHLARAFLARPRIEGTLDLESGINPYYAGRLEELRARLFEPILGPGVRELSRARWQELVELFAPYQAWMDRRPKAPVDKIELARLREYVEDPSYEAAARSLIEKSHETALALDNVRLVEKLILYQAHLLALVNSFVSFPDLYDPHSRALFEMGTLIIDGRHFTLSVKVPDRARHAKFSNASNMFMLYVEIVDTGGKKLYEVAVPVTAGGRGNLQVGKRGIFLDRAGREWQARVVEVVENPISLREAIVSPVRRLGRAISGRIEKISATAEEKLEAAGADTVTQVQASAAKAREQAPAAAVAAPSSGSSLGGTLAGGGIAVAALGSSVAFVTKTLASMNPMTMLVVLLGGLLAVIVPASIVAFLKLRQRDLSAILEGSEWGINARMYLTRRQSRTFTFRPPYPPGAHGIRRRRWWTWLLVAILLGAVLFYWLVARGDVA